MPLRDLLIDVAEGWPAYRGLRTTRKDHPEYELVVRSVPRELAPLLPSGPSFKVEGSTGRGNITAAPWIATFDRSITSSATRGYYVVYLYSVDLRRLYLSLAFGTTQFEEYFSKADERHRKLRSAASHLQPLLPMLRPVHLGPLDLAAGRADRMHLDYQHANIAAIKYDLAALPSNEELQADYKFMVKLYRDLVENPLTPSSEQLFEVEVTPPSGAVEPVVTLFVERAPKLPGKRVGARMGLRLSKESKKIGDRGELIVYEYEQAKVRRLGRDPSLVRWLAREGAMPGWDITSADETGAPIYIEVKASVGSAVESLLVTSKEWIAAGKFGASYYIYLVTHVMKAVPKIEIIGNPAQLVELGVLQAETASWWLELISARVAAPASPEEAAPLNPAST